MEIQARINKSGNGNSLCGTIIHCLASLVFIKVLFPITLYAREAFLFHDFVNNPGQGKYNVDCKTIIGLGLIATATSALGASLVSRFGFRLGLKDEPTSRSSHNKVTPKGGGIGIVVAFLITAINLAMPITFWLPLGILAVLSFRGDQTEISPEIRLLLQLILAGILVFGTRMVGFGNVITVSIALFTIVFVVGTANFFNFMDGINGIAGISGAVGFGLMGFAIIKEHTEMGLLCVFMVLACLGFLPFNIPRARVFMGDVGSILLGSVFADLACMAAHSLLDFISLVSFLFPFYSDELTTMIVRLFSGENLARPHRRHLYQLLANECQIPHWRISIGYGLLQLLIGVNVLWVKPLGVEVVLAVLSCWFTIFMLFSFYVRNVCSLSGKRGTSGRA